MEELGCMGVANVHGGCGNVWGRRLSMGDIRVRGAGEPMKIKDRAAEHG